MESASCSVYSISDRQHLDPESPNSKRRFGTSAGLLDYLFRAKAVEAIGTGEQFLRLFAPYYAAISLLSLPLVLPIFSLQIAFPSLHI